MYISFMSKMVLNGIFYYTSFHKILFTTLRSVNIFTIEILILSNHTA